jgi:fructosamine-3-kinase
MNPPSTNSPQVNFTNKPKLSSHDVDRDFDERRIKLVPHIEAFISNHPRFKDKEVSVTFTHEGVSSLVSVIETSDEKLILKIPLNLSDSSSESHFLKAWENVGVKVPHIIEEGVISEHSYMLMEYVDAPIVSEAYSHKDLAEKGIYTEMGSTLRAMHKTEAEGYGRLINGKAEFSQFKDWLLSEKIQRTFRYAKENGLFSEEHGSTTLACELLIEYMDDKRSSYCHFDFDTSNMFATSPITVFDPNPELNNGYIDLGRSLVIHTASAGIYPRQLIEGYFADEVYDTRVLQAAILLNSCMKFHYWHQKGKWKHIRNIQEYLIKNNLL